MSCNKIANELQWVSNKSQMSHKQVSDELQTISQQITEFIDWVVVANTTLATTLEKLDNKVPNKLPDEKQPHFPLWL